MRLFAQVRNNADVDAVDLVLPKLAVWPAKGIVPTAGIAVNIGVDRSTRR